MKKLLTTAAVAATLALSTAGSALAVTATFDFGALADPNGSTGGSNEGTWSSRPDNASIAGGKFVSGEYFVNGIGVKATASNNSTTGSPVSVAYLDGFASGDIAGLGVCSSVDTTQCSIPSDDNTGMTGDGKFSDSSLNGYFESVTLTFSEAVSLTSLVLRDRDHDLLQSAIVGIKTSSGFDDQAFNFVAGAVLGLGSAKEFTFSRVTGGDDFYIGSAVAAVPLPAALPLAMAAFGGLALLGRRRKAVA